MPVPNTFGTATSAIPLSQLDANFATPITIGNTAVQLGNTVTTLNNMTLANVTISSGTITITNVAVTTANVSGTANISTLVVVGNETVGGNTSVTGNSTVAGSVVLSGGTANGVAYLNTSKQLTTGSALTWDGSALAVTGTLSASGIITSTATAGQVVKAESGTTGILYSNFANTGGTFLYGIDNSAGTALFSGSAAYAGFIGTSGARPLVLATNGAGRAFIDSSGNVGIGTSSPGYKLDVLGNVNRFAGAGVDGIFLSTVAATDTSYYGANYYNNNGTEGVNAPGRASWRIETVTAGSPTFSIGYRAASAGAGVFSTPLTIDSSGNLGLGVTPSAWSSTTALQVGSVGGAISSASTQISLSYNWVATSTGNKYITNGFSSIYQQNAGAHAWYNAPSGTAGNAITFTQAMTLDASGNLGIGATSPAGGANRVVDVYGSGSSAINFHNATSGTTATDGGVVGQYGSDLVLYNYEAGIIQFGTSNTEAARIDSSGNLLVGKTSSGQTVNGIEISPKYGGTANNPVLSVVTGQAGGTPIVLYSTTASAYRFYVEGTGQINATFTTITAISDQRLKENIRDLDDGLASVMALKPRKFDWKEGKGQDIKDARGFIAQEFETVFPDMISEWLDPAPEGEEPYKAINANLIPTLVKAIQELKAEFDAYKASHP